MPLNKAKGNMYGFVTHTKNIIKGVCPHNCSYCYMRKWWPSMKPPRVDEKELGEKVGIEKTIFMGSGIDMWAEGIPDEWIRRVLNYCDNKFPNNTWFFQSKNPGRFGDWISNKKSILCTTIETTDYYQIIMGKCPPPEKRYQDFANLKQPKKMVTIEPIMDFNITKLLYWLIDINPIQINIGADSGGNHLPEPSTKKLKLLIDRLMHFNLKVHLKPNLNRLLKE